MTGDQVIRLWQHYAPEILRALNLSYPFLEVSGREDVRPWSAESLWFPAEGECQLTINLSQSWSEGPSAGSNDWWWVLLHEIAHSFWASARATEIVNTVVKSRDARVLVQIATENVVDCIARSLMSLFPRPEIEEALSVPDSPNPPD